MCSLRNFQSSIFNSQFALRHGFLLINKERGPTSHDVVSAVRRRLHEPKAGHLGTLDPMATGLLVVAVGAKALKVVELFKNLTKEYVAGITLGAVSNTYDAEGMITESPYRAGWQPPVDTAPIQVIIKDRFLGRFSQVPPAHSAVHVGGVRAYELARSGKPIAIVAREVDITACEILEYSYPHLKLRIACSSGTYIRALAHDLGQAMRCGGYLESLERTRVGEWAVDVAHLSNDVDWKHVIPLKEILKVFPGVEIGDKEWGELKHGRSIDGLMQDPTLIAWFEGLPVAILETDSKRNGYLKPRKVIS